MHSNKNAAYMRNINKTALDTHLIIQEICLIVTAEIDMAVSLPASHYPKQLHIVATSDISARHSPVVQLHLRCKQNIDSI